MTNTSKVIAEALNHKELEEHYDKLLDIIVRQGHFTHNGMVYFVTSVDEYDKRAKASQKRFNKAYNEAMRQL